MTKYKVNRSISCKIYSNNDFNQLGSYFVTEQYFSAYFWEHLFNDDLKAHFFVQALEVSEINQRHFSDFRFLDLEVRFQIIIALWRKLFRKWEIGKFTKIITSPLIFSQYDYFRENIWRLSSVQFHFCYIFGDYLTTANCRRRVCNRPSFNSSRLRKEVNQVWEAL